MRTALLAGLLAFTLSAAQAQTTDNLVRGNEFYRQGRFDLAEEQYRRALESEPGNATARFNLGNALQQQKKFDEAARVLGQLATETKDPRVRAAAWYNQGVAYTKLKNLDASIESYKNALRADPNDRQARENLEKALLEKKKQTGGGGSSNKQDPKMSQKEAEQKLKLLQQKERELQQRRQGKQQGQGQAQDW